MAEEAVEFDAAEDFDMEEGVAEMSTMFGAKEEKEDDFDLPVEEPTEEIEEDVVDTEGKVTRKEEIEEEKIDMPASWKKERQDQWDKIPKETQEYFIQRENEMKNGIEIAKDDAKMGREMRDIFQPYEKLFNDAGIEPKEATRRLMNAHYRLATASPEQRVALMHEVAQGYGVNLTGEQPKIDPVVQNLQNKFNQIEHKLTVSEQKAQQAESERIQGEVNSFAAEHPLFDDLADDISDFIRAGFTLEDAYEKSLWANPVTRQKELDRIQKESLTEAQKKAEQEAEAAKKAKSVNIKGRDTTHSPTAKKGKMFDNLDKLYDDINSREH